MTNDAYNELLIRWLDDLTALCERKGQEYANSDDRLANFKRNGAALGLPPETVLMVYAGKHWDAVCRYVRCLRSGQEIRTAEPIDGRVDDLINYLLLLKALLFERQQSLLERTDNVQSVVEGN